MIVTPRQIARWAARYELNLFTGRTRQEFLKTFDTWPAAQHFHTVITMDDAPKKPLPDGLIKILQGRDPGTALYLGDNIDDALAAQAAGVPFLAVLSSGEYDHRERAARFSELGALGLLKRATDLNRWLARAKSSLNTRGQ
jgi:phosphoglycolate phosphatase-like HAD superfamily hydrolase